MGQKSLTPVFLIEGNYTKRDLNSFKKKNRIWQVVDIFKNQLEELFEITNPKLKLSAKFKQSQEQFINLRSQPDPTLKGNWIYYPDSGYFIHTLSKTDYLKLRTNRNRELINKKEQVILEKACIGLVGMSIGSHFALSLAYSSIGSKLKLADFDHLSTTNLNRVKAALKDVGSYKLDIVSSQIYQIDPYTDLYTFPEGLNRSNLVTFVSSNPKPSLIFEAIDDLGMKIALRQAAKKAGVAVIMLTNLGDNLMIDVERFDLDPSLPLFNGLVTEETLLEITKENVPKDLQNKLVIKLVGVQNIPPRALDSIQKINKTLVGRPQLFSTVSVGGGFAAYLARLILLKRPLKSGRYLISFDKLVRLND